MLETGIYVNQYENVCHKYLNRHECVVNEWKTTGAENWTFK
jgi:hypothetical protein